MTSPSRPSFVGLTSAGVYQINLIVPPGLGEGAVPVRLLVGGMQSQSACAVFAGGVPVVTVRAVFWAADSLEAEREWIWGRIGRRAVAERAAAPMAELGAGNGGGTGGWIRRRIWRRILRLRKKPYLPRLRFEPRRRGSEG